MKQTLILITLVAFISCGKQETKITDVKKVDIVATEHNSDTEMGKYIDKYKGDKDKIMSVKIGETAVELPIERHNSPLGNLIAKMMYERAASMMTVDAVITNWGGIRRNLFAGDVTVGDVYEILPFDNTAVVLTFTGTQLQAVADAMAKKGGETMYNISFDIVDDKAENVNVKGEKLDAEKTYMIVSNDYLEKGNDRLRPMADHIEAKNLNIQLRQIAIDYIKANPTIK